MASGLNMRIFLTTQTQVAGTKGHASLIINDGSHPQCCDRPLAKLAKHAVLLKEWLKHAVPQLLDFLNPECIPVEKEDTGSLLGVINLEYNVLRIPEEKCLDVAIAYGCTVNCQKQTVYEVC